MVEDSGKKGGKKNLSSKRSFSRSIYHIPFCHRYLDGSRRIDSTRVRNGIETESRRSSKLHRWIPLSGNWLSSSTSKSTNEGRGLILGWNRFETRVSKALKAERWREKMDGSPLSLRPFLRTNIFHWTWSYVSNSKTRMNVRPGWMSSGSGRIWSTGVGGRKKQRGLLMTRQTNRWLEWECIRWISRMENVHLDVD